MQLEPSVPRMHIYFTFKFHMALRRNANLLYSMVNRKWPCIYIALLHQWLLKALYSHKVTFSMHTSKHPFPSAGNNSGFSVAQGHFGVWSMFRGSNCQPSGLRTSPLYLLSHNLYAALLETSAVQHNNIVPPANWPNIVQHHWLQTVASAEIFLRKVYEISYMHVSLRQNAGKIKFVCSTQHTQWWRSLQIFL